MFPFTDHLTVFKKTKKVEHQGGQGGQSELPFTEGQLKRYNQQLKSRKSYNADILRESKSILDDIYEIVKDKHKTHTIAVVDLNNWGYEKKRNFTQRNQIDPESLVREIVIDPRYHARLGGGKVFWVFVGQKKGRGIEFQHNEHWMIIMAGCVYRDEHDGRQHDCYRHGQQILRMNPVDDMVIKNLMEYLKRQRRKEEQTIQTKTDTLTPTAIAKKIARLRKKAVVYVGQDLFRDLKRKAIS